MKTPAAPATTGNLVEVSVEIDQLIENPRNPNKHPADQINKLMASLRSRGQLRPVLARAANHMLIGGHGVRQAAKQLGWTHITVALWDVDQATADQAMLADNRLGRLSSDDNSRVAELLREIAPTDWLGVGYDADEAGKLINDLAGDELEIRRIDTSKTDDKFWISVRGPLREQADTLQALKKLLADRPGVSIELGTQLL